MTNPLTPAWTAFKTHRRALIVMNVLYFGIVLVGMGLTLLFPSLRDAGNAASALLSFDLPMFDYALEGYVTGNMVQAALGTVSVNIIVAAVMTTIPSLIIPFVGIVLVYYRAMIWGPMFAPLGPEGAILIPHAPTLITEGFCYVLAAFGAYVHGQMVLRPQHYGFASRWAAYRAGLTTVGSIFLVMVLILVVAAIYEAYEIIHLTPYFLPAPQ